MSRRANHLGKILLWAVACVVATTAWGAEDTNKVFRARAEATFYRTQALLQTDANNSSNAWVFARACYDLVQFSTNKVKQADIARLGITACEQLVKRDPKSAAGHYYLAMNYGELADAVEPSLTAYRLIRDIEREFKAALALDETFDFAGPDRCLGLLYRDAPGWPISIGSWHKAREYLERADVVAPNFPENQLNLAESYLQWREDGEAGKNLKKLESTWNSAQTNLTGEAWEVSWRDWVSRRIAARIEFQKLFKRVPGT
ncbi:MAG TPA: hypothetical protein VG347_17985 [Verrucomicrobiae bacterium]|nr:hypothetical protein [Verrucomicrobiae bacterium]